MVSWWDIPLCFTLFLSLTLHKTKFDWRQNIPFYSSQRCHLADRLRVTPGRPDVLLYRSQGSPLSDTQWQMFAVSLFQSSVTFLWTFDLLYCTYLLLLLQSFTFYSCGVVAIHRMLMSEWAVCNHCLLKPPGAFFTCTLNFLRGCKTLSHWKMGLKDCRRRPRNCVYVSVCKCASSQLVFTLC